MHVWLQKPVHCIQNTGIEPPRPATQFWFWAVTVAASSSTATARSICAGGIFECELARIGGVAAAPAGCDMG
jgi:hypothetical protein